RSARRRSRPAATRYGARGRAFPATAISPVPRRYAAQAHSQAGTLGMAELHAPMQRGEFSVAGRLIEHRIALHRLCKGFGVRLFLDVEGVEAGAQHEHELVAQHLTGGAQFAAIA